MFFGFLEKRKKSIYDDVRVVDRYGIQKYRFTENIIDTHKWRIREFYFCKGQ